MTDVPNDQLNQAFTSMAGHLGLRLSPAAFEVGEHTDIGLFLGPLASPVMDFEATPTPEPTEDDDRQIEELIRGWESASLHDLRENLSDFATEDFLLVVSDGIGRLTSDTFESEDEMEARMGQYPVHSPRQVTVSNVQIVHIGGARAAATYTFEEQYTDGTSLRANALCLAVKLEAGWRLALATDHLAS